MIEVIQSASSARPAWIDRCMASVESWAEAHSMAYRFEDDALFERLPVELRDKTADQPVIAADLARLLWAQERLAAGVDAVVWLDADVLVTEPGRFQLPDTPYALGREIWVQPDGSGNTRWRSHVKVHNAALLFRRGNSFLDFYADSARSILQRHRPGPMVPQLIGPKLLTAIHNAIGGGPVWEHAGMLSPWVIRDLLDGGGAALDRFRADSRVTPAAANLCQSAVRRGDLSDEQMDQVISLLLDAPGLLAASIA